MSDDEDIMEQMTMDPYFQEFLKAQPVKRSIFDITTTAATGFIMTHSPGFSPIHIKWPGDNNSVQREIDSDNSEYVIQKIRDEHISGSSCTVALCGADTPNRKFVDWEIKATLSKEHGLIAVQLPSNSNFIVPERLLDNVSSGFALIRPGNLLGSSFYMKHLYQFPVRPRIDA